MLASLNPYLGWQSSITPPCTTKYQMHIEEGENKAQVTFPLGKNVAASVFPISTREKQTRRQW